MISGKSSKNEKELSGRIPVIRQKIWGLQAPLAGTTEAITMLERGGYPGKRRTEVGRMKSAEAAYEE